MKLWHEIAGEGPPVLLIHEGICDARMWERQMRTFSSEHETIRCDLRGFGHSPLPAETYSHADDVIELLDGLGLGLAGLVGVSLGGRVALEVAVCRPDLVGRLVLVGAALLGHDWSEAMQRYWNEEDALLETGDLDAAVELNLRIWVDGPRRGPEDVDPQVRRQVGAMQRRSFELQLPVWEEAQEELLVPDLGDRLVDVSAPTLTLVGEEDVPDIHAIAERLVREIPQTSGATIGGTAHVPSLERPEEFDDLVLEFLGSGKKPPQA